METTITQYVSERQAILTSLQNLDVQVSLDDILKTLKKLETLAAEKAAEMNIKTNQTEVLLEKNIDKINVYYQEIQQVEHERGELEIAYAGLSEQLKQDEIALHNYEHTLDQLRNQLDEAHHRERKARAELEKWCWVPGYGIYLLVDYQQAVDDLNCKIKSVMGQANQLRNRMNQLEAGRQQINSTCWENRQMVKTINEKVAACKKEQEKLLEDQKELRDALLQWQAQSLYFRLLQEKLSSYQTMAEIIGEASAEIRQLINQAPEIKFLI